MTELIFISGGARSGKSAYAQRLAENFPGTKLYLATCPVVDTEMEERIHRHREQRNSSIWETWEVPVKIKEALLRPHPHRVILLDCLSLWVNNLMYTAKQSGETISEGSIAELTIEIISALPKREEKLIVVSNEVGMGIVPDYPQGRLFRDLLGRANQIFAQEASRVIFMVSGVPLFIKGTPA